MKTKKQAIELKKLRVSKEELKYKGLALALIAASSTTLILIFGL